MAAENSLEGLLKFEGPSLYGKTHRYMKTIIDASRQYTKDVEDLQRRERNFFGKTSEFSKRLKAINEENLLKVGALVGGIHGSLELFEGFSYPQPVKSPDPTRRNYHSTDSEDDYHSDDFA